MSVSDALQLMVSFGIFTIGLGSV
ncbi:putative holin-like toxin [Lentilactobacillus buchneri]